jgi:hypothetical protein
MHLPAPTILAVLAVVLSPGAGATPCHPQQQYNGADLLAVDPSYETLALAQLELWSQNSTASGMTASVWNVRKSFFRCVSAAQVDLVHWCACGIADTSANGTKDGEACVMPCSGPTPADGRAGLESRAGRGLGSAAAMAAVCAAAVGFAAGMV